MSTWRKPQSAVVGGGKQHSGCLYRALVLLCGACQEQARVEAATEADEQPLPWEQRP